MFSKGAILNVRIRAFGTALPGYRTASADTARSACAPCASFQPELAFNDLAKLLRGGMAKTSCPNFRPSHGQNLFKTLLVGFCRFAKAQRIKTRKSLEMLPNDHATAKAEARSLPPISRSPSIFCKPIARAIRSTPPACPNPNSTASAPPGARMRGAAANSAL